MTSLLFDPGECHQAWQLFTGGHDKHLILGVNFMLAAGYTGGDTPCNGDYAKMEFVINLRDFL